MVRRKQEIRNAETNEVTFSIIYLLLDSANLPSCVFVDTPVP